MDGRSLTTVPLGTDIVCGCSILLFACKLFGTRLFLLSVNGLGLAAPTLTVRLCLLWSIWLDSTPAGRKNSKFNTRWVVQCPRHLFSIYIFLFLFNFCFANRLSAHTKSGHGNRIFVWSLSMELYGTVHTKPSEKDLRFQSSGESRTSDNGGEGPSKKNKGGPGPPTPPLDPPLKSVRIRVDGAWRSCTNCILLFL